MCEIAVVGVACRLPGASTPRAFWELLRDGRDAITDVPADRWAVDVSLPELARGGFLDRVDLFDAEFFGISPREAAAMDPQQKLILELAWEALEDAGIIAAALAGTATGTFIGAIAGDYGELTRASAATITRHALTGTNRGVIANRVAYALGLRGPSLSVDSAQSSGLVAVHLACQSLRCGESTLALAGGVGLNLSPAAALGPARLGALSGSGRCATFDCSGDGYVRGEGGGVVALKPLDVALVDGDRIHAVIRGSAVNNDGGGDGLTVPDADAQASVIGLACRCAGVDAAEVQYVELHGTGTPLGDRVEAAALGAALGRDRDAALVVGSAKTNVGHLEGAAGTVGLIKAILCVSHRELPASLNFSEPPVEIPLVELGLRVQRALGPWPSPERPLVAGVSSFGMGGTNCHVVLGEAPASRRSWRAVTDPAPAPIGGVIPWVLSARSEAALAAQAAALLKHVGSLGDLDALGVGRSLADLRTRFSHRAVILGADASELLDGVRALAAGEPSPRVVSGVARDGGERPVFLFPGVGSQWPAMGRELLEASPVFAERIAACDAALGLDFSVADVLREADRAADLERTAVVQPVLFATMVSLAALWRACGVEPAAVVGHSQGEIAAAHVAGALSLEDAARIIARRSQVLGELNGDGGAMGSLAIGTDELAARLARWDGPEVTLAVSNGASSSVVAGAAGAVDLFLERCRADGIRVRRVPVDYASHSRHVEPVRDALIASLSEIAPRAAETMLVSTVTAEAIDTTTMGPEYWYRNLRETVRYEPVIRGLLESGHRRFVELSPHPVLTGGTQETIDATGVDATFVGTLQRENGGSRRFLASLAEHHVRGGAVAWSALLAGARRVELPTYAFQRERYWLTGLAAGIAAGSAVEPDEEPTQDRHEGGLAARLAGLPEGERERAALDLVLAQAAIVLGHASTAAIDPNRRFKELGFDSVAAVQVRNALARVTGLRLPATLLFDRPTPLVLARHLVAEATSNGSAPAALARGSRGSRDDAGDDPIAIVGIGCRYPGGVRSPEDLWDLVAASGEAISDFPTDRGWDLERLYDPDPGTPGTCYTRRGGFIEDAADFDAAFFGISSREALAMDPQQRLLLEVVWEALEHAGIDPDALRETDTGVFAGLSTSDYALLSDSSELEGFRLTGGAGSVLSGRIAFSFGFEGPAVTVDTACSASLVAMHQACSALRAGECSMALAGGVTVLSTPLVFVEFSRLRGLAEDGRCKSFAAAADGTGWSEGAGIVVLERLSDAVREGHRVLALVRGSAVNQDGASNGLTAPRGPAQERLILAALRAARLSPTDVDAVEAHGTGTVLGDPIEAQALLATYGRGRVRPPLWLGSLKSNLGHTQAAAGIGGVIKTVMALQHELLPASLHLDAGPSQHVDWSAGGVELLREPVAWPAGARVRRAGVSSFGVSGTNAHVILEEPPAASGERRRADAGPGQGAAADIGPCPLLLSARTTGALAAAGARLRDFWAEHLELDPLDVAYTLAAGRARLRRRAVLVGRDRAELLAGLDALVTDATHPGLTIGSARRNGDGGLLNVDPAPLLERGARRVTLPTYPFQRRRYWPDGAASEPPAITVSLNDRSY